jgi:hypothetical protein
MCHMAEKYHCIRNSLTAIYSKGRLAGVPNVRCASYKATGAPLLLPAKLTKEPLLGAKTCTVHQSHHGETSLRSRNGIIKRMTRNTTTKWSLRSWSQTPTFFFQSSSASSRTSTNLGICLPASRNRLTTLSVGKLLQ